MELSMRYCKECGIEVGKGESFCKECLKSKEKIYNKAYIQRPEIKERLKEYRRRPEAKKYRKEYYKREDIKLKYKEYNQRPEVKARNKRNRDRIRKKPEFVLNNRMTSSIGKHLRFKGTSKNKRKWEQMVGYTVIDLKQHLENLFTEGMSWDKLMSGDIHIDHMVPKNLFKYNIDDLENCPEFRYCWSLDNLQPLWAEDNLRKEKILYFK